MDRAREVLAEYCGVPLPWMQGELSVTQADMLRAMLAFAGEAEARTIERAAMVADAVGNRPVQAPEQGVWERSERATGKRIAAAIRALASAPASREGKMAEPTLMDEINKLCAVMKPVFDEQRAEWELEGPAAMAAFNATGATLDTIGGNCPVQAEGDVDGKRFYFRARGDGWEFHVADSDDLIFDAPVFYIDREYGSWPDAGWMPQHEAIGFIVASIGEYRARTPDTTNKEG